jgi:hypothetical protein
LLVFPALSGVNINKEVADRIVRNELNIKEVYFFIFHFYIFRKNNKKVKCIEI